MNNTIKNYLGAALIVLALVAAFGIFQYTTFYARSAQSPRSFSVSGQGKVTGIPDVAQFTFGVITQGGTEIASLQDQNSKRGNAIIDFIKAQGVADKDIQTQSYTIEPRYQNLYCPQSSTSCPPPEIVGYTVTQTVTVKIRDFSRISGILSGVAAKGANSVSQLSFKIDDPTNLQNQAMEKAMQEARKQAQALAAAGGFKLGRLISVGQGNVYPQPLYATGEIKGMGGVATVPSVEPGSQEISSVVSLTYEIQ